MEEHLDKIIYIIITIVIFVFSAIRKNVKQQEKKASIPEMPPELPKEEKKYETITERIDKKNNLDDLEDMVSLKNVEPEKQVNKGDTSYRQNPKTLVPGYKEKTESGIDINFDDDELKKGIIYSEILNPKYDSI